MSLKNFRPLKALFTFAAITLGFVWAGSFARCYAQSPVLSGGAILDCSGLPCIDLQLPGGQHLKMLIDTGNANSTLDASKAKEIGIEVKAIVGADGKPNPTYSIGTLKNIHASDASLGDLKMLVLNLGPDIAKGSMPQSDGTLAYTAFRGRVLQLDYKRRSFGVSAVLKASIPCPANCGEITYPTFGKEGPPIVVATGFNVEGKPVMMQIDTLYAGTMLIYSTSVTKLGFSHAASGPKKRFFPFTDDGVQMIEDKASTLGFSDAILLKNAPLYFVTPSVHQPDGMFDGTVGDELFRGHVLILNFYQNEFSMR